MQRRRFRQRRRVTVSSRPFASLYRPSSPATPGPATEERLRIQRQDRFPNGSPITQDRVNLLKRELFGMGPPVTRNQAAHGSQDNVDDSGTLNTTPETALQDLLQEPLLAIEDQDVPQDAGSPRRPHRPAPPEVDDAITRMTQLVERAVQAAQQHANAPRDDVLYPEDPNFNWDALGARTFPELRLWGREEYNVSAQHCTPSSWGTSSPDGTCTRSTSSSRLQDPTRTWRMRRRPRWCNASTRCTTQHTSGGPTPQLLPPAWLLTSALSLPAPN